MANILDMIFGQKTNVVGMPQEYFGPSIFDAIMTDIQAMPEFENLGNLYQQYVVGGISNLIPQFKQMLQLGGENVVQGQKNALSWQKGQLDPATLANISGSSAMAALGSGLMGSPAGIAGYGRNIGLGTTQLEQMGAQLAGQAGNAAQLWSNIASGTILSPSSFLGTPEQFYQAKLQSDLIQRNIKQQRANVAAAPDPIMKGISDIVANLTAAYLGSLGGGGFGGGGGGGGGGGAGAYFGPETETSQALGPALESGTAGMDSGSQASNLVPSAGASYGMASSIGGGKGAPPLDWAAFNAPSISSPGVNVAAGPDISSMTGVFGSGGDMSGGGGMDINALMSMLSSMGMGGGGTTDTLPSGYGMFGMSQFG